MISSVKALLGSRFAWKLFASYAFLVLATALILGVVAHREQRESMMLEIEQGLRNQAATLGPYSLPLFEEVAADPATGPIRTSVQQRMERIGRESEIRITLVDLEGRVLADSEADPRAMENHRSRPEIREAFGSGYGVSRRYSQTLEQYHLYVARAVPRDGEPLGVVRVAIPLADVQTRLAELRWNLVAGGGLAILGALVLGLYVARRITAPLEEMTGVAEALCDEEYDRRVRRLPTDEIGTLGTALNQLAAELTSRIASLSRERARFRAIMSGMEEGVLAVDDEDRIVFSNDTARSLLEMDARPEGEAPKIWEAARILELTELLAEARGGVAGARREITVTRDDGPRIVEAQATRFQGGGETGCVVVFHDITDLRKLEGVRQDFVANVSHELKTPLTTVKGYVETLLDGAIHDEANNLRFLEKIDEQVRRLDHLVADLLELARIDSPDESLELTDVDWRDVVDVAARRRHRTVESKGLTLELDLPPEPVVVRGDREATLQVVDNLLDNAIKYTAAPGEIRIRLRAEGPEGRLDVEDTGVGIPRRARNRIFERFYRIDRGRSREAGGTGLGLSIVRNLVRAMAGEVEVDSDVGAGSRFTVRLPLAKSRPDEDDRTEGDDRAGD